MYNILNTLIGGLLMKKIILIFLLLLTIFFQGQDNYVDANTITDLNVNEQSEKTIIEELFLSRISLWNNVYDGIYDIKTFEDKLREIEEDPLLSYDIKSFEEMKSAPTDMDKVLNFSLLNVEDISYGRSTMKANIKVLWKMQGQNSYYYEETDYNVELKKTNEGWKLLDFNITQ